MGNADHLIDSFRDQPDDTPLERAYSRLEDLHLECDGGLQGGRGGSARILSYFHDSPLRYTSLPFSGLALFLSNCNAASVPPKPYLTPLQTKLHSVLDRGLDSLTLYDICFSKGANGPCSCPWHDICLLLSPRYVITTLVIGTRTFSFLNGPDAGYGRSPTPQILFQEISTWKGLISTNSLRHLRLEQVELSLLKLSHFDFALLTSLRVLMLYPVSHAREYNSSSQLTSAVALFRFALDRSRRATYSKTIHTDSPTTRDAGSYNSS